MKTGFKLNNKLDIIHIHVLPRRLGALKMNSTTFHWFRKSHRPFHPSNGLGPYRFLPIVTYCLKDWSPLHALATFGDEMVMAKILHDWPQDGTMHVDNFSWWWEDDCQIRSIVLQETKMHHYHQW